MSDEYIQRVAPLECRLLLSKMEIDDDDQDVVFASVEISNEASIPVGGLDIFIQTSDKRKVESDEGISSIGPGLTRKFTFEFPLENGDWTFMVRSNNITLDLGPYDFDFTFEADKDRVTKNSIGAGMFSNAFVSDLDDFGNVEERGIIDATEIKMTDYFGENSAGGATAISVGKAPEDTEDEEDSARVPPWQSKDPLLSTPIPTTSLEPASTAAPEVQAKLESEQSQSNSSDLLAFSKSLDEEPSEPTQEDTSSVLTAASPPPLPPTSSKKEEDPLLKQPL
ncbi:MAG: hypothetical protein HON16_03720, partial [Euryarchaeota archaeon]|nr:hypothetical protein [Euryarchaeota archaeon]